MKKGNISEQIRTIQYSKLDPTQKHSEIKKLFNYYTQINLSDFLFYDFIQTVSKVVLNSINSIKNFVPIEFNLCSLDNAKKFSSLIGIHVVQIHSTMYLSWAAPLNN